MAFSNLTDEEIQVGKALKQETLQKIKDSLEDLKSDVVSFLETSAVITVANITHQLPDEVVPVGTIFHGTTAHTGSGNGSGAVVQTAFNTGIWLLCDGSNASAYSYGGYIPDARGRFLRNRNLASSVNPSETALGANAADRAIDHAHGNSFGLTGTTSFNYATDTHVHDIRHDHLTASRLSDGTYRNIDQHVPTGDGTTNTRNDVFAQAYVVPQPGGAGSGGILAMIPVTGDQKTYYTGGVHDTINSGSSSSNGTCSIGFTGSIGNSGGASETAPKYTAVNMFIKVHKSYLNSREFAVRIPSTMSINNIKFSQIRGAGATGNIVVNVRKANAYNGTRTSVLSGIYNISPSASTVNIAGIVNGAAAPGDYFFIEVTATQANRLENIHIFVGASPVVEE